MFLNSSPVPVSKSVFKLIFVLSNYQTCTFPLNMERLIYNTDTEYDIEDSPYATCYIVQSICSGLSGHYCNFYGLHEISSNILELLVNGMY